MPSVMTAVRIPTAKQIKAIRERLGLSVEEAAERVGTTRPQWVNWESGKRTPSRQSAILIRLLAENKI